MKKLFTPGVILIWITIISCSTSEGDEKPDFTDFYTSKNLQSDLELSRIGGFVINSGMTTAGDLISPTDSEVGRLHPYFVSSPIGKLHAFRDEINQHVVVVDDNGYIQAVVGSIGRGPKEFSKIEMYNFSDENTLVISDMGSLLFKIMDLSNELISTVKFDIATYATSSLYNIHKYNGVYYKPVVERRLGATFKDYWKSALVVKYDTDGNVINSFGKHDPHLYNPTTYGSFPAITIDSEKNKLLSIHSSNHQIQVFDLDTDERVKWFGYQPENFIYSEQYIDGFLPREKIMELTSGTSGGSMVYSCENLIYHTYRIITMEFYHNRDFNQDRHFIAVYDSDSYDYHGEVEAPFVIGNITNGKIYMIEDDDPDNFQVGIYTLELSENT